MEAGKLRHRVTIQRQEVVQDSNGDTLVLWVDQGIVWAAIEPLSAKEFIQSGSEQNKVVARITIRCRPGIIPSMRVVHSTAVGGTKVYNITGVLADKESGLEYLTLPCSEGVNDGQ